MGSSLAQSSLNAENRVEKEILQKNGMNTSIWDGGRNMKFLTRMTRETWGEGQL